MRRLILIAALILILAGFGWLYLVRTQETAPVPPAPAPPVADSTTAGPSLPDLAGQVLQSGCRQGQCVWLRVARADTVSTSTHGTLRRLTGRRGMSRYDDEAPEAWSPRIAVTWDPRDQSVFAFCSTERPAYAFSDEGGAYILHYLDLFDLAGFQMASAATYLTICNDRPPAIDDDAALRALGYRPGTRNEQVEEGTPEDMARF
jgi:hypothetical protein